jgi:hypothetical protein
MRLTCESSQSSTIRRVAAAVFGGALSLAACSGGGSEQSSTSTAQSTSAPTVETTSNPSTSTTVVESSVDCLSLPGAILYVSDVDGNNDIYAQTVAAAQLPQGAAPYAPIRITDTGDNLNPQVSLQGDEIVWYSDKDSADGGYDVWRQNLQNLAQSPTQILDHADSINDPTFSSDGARLFYKRAGQIWQVPYNNGAPDIAQEQPLTGGVTGLEEWKPTSLPDGSVVFTAGVNALSDLFRRMPDGSVVQLTANNTDDWYPEYGNASGWVAYVTKVGDGITDRIYTMLPDGSNVRPVVAAETFAGELADPSWASDHCVLLIGSDVGSQTGYDVYMVDTNTGILMQLPGISTDGRELSPVYSPIKLG